MRRALVMLAIAVGFVACQKNVDWANTNLGGSDSTGTGGTGGGSTTGSLLVKRVSNTLTDSAAESFTYDASKRIAAYNIIMLDKVTGDVGDYRTRIVRDAQGRVVKVMDSAMDTPGVWDTITSVIHYNGTSVNASYSIAHWSPTQKDSIVFTYSNNKITKSTLYEYDSVNDTYSLGDESTFSYDANGNVVNSKFYTFTGTSAVLGEEKKYTYDTKVAALKFGSEAILIAMANGGVMVFIEDAAGSNNATKIESIDHTSGSGTPYDILSLSYTYRSNNTPDKANMSSLLLGTPIPLGTVTFFYQ